MESTNILNAEVNNTENTKIININFPITINFGENKILSFRPWKGRERRFLQKIINGDITDNIETVLIYNCMENLTYLTKKEITYTLLKLFAESYSYELQKEFICSCGESNNVMVDLNTVLNQKILSNFESVSTGQYTFSIDSSASFNPLFFNKQIIVESEFDKLFNELCIHLSEIYKDGEEVLFRSFDELLEFMDNIPAKDFDELFNQYTLKAFSFIAITKYTCSNEDCKSENIEFIDAIDEMANRFYL
jgi:hypothetical protein